MSGSSKIGYGGNCSSSHLFVRQSGNVSPQSRASACEKLAWSYSIKKYSILQAGFNYCEVVVGPLICLVHQKAGSGLPQTVLFTLKACMGLRDVDACPKETRLGSQFGLEATLSFPRNGLGLQVLGIALLEARKALSDPAFASWAFSA